MKSGGRVGRNSGAPQLPAPQPLLPAPPTAVTVTAARSLHPLRPAPAFPHPLFLFNNYSDATYLNHDPVPARCPRGGVTLQAPLCPLPRPVPKRK